MTAIINNITSANSNINEIPDRNKTEITLRITESAAEWLRTIGAKAIETEVCAGPKWISDLAAFWVPTPSEAIYAKLLPKKPRWQTSHIEYRLWRESFEALPNPITIIHEVKTSNADFKRDTKWNRESIADLQVLSYLKGIISIEQIPDKWWGLEHSESGNLIAIRKRAPLNNVTDKQRLLLISNLADRQHNRHANAFFSSLNKSHGLESHRKKTNNRLNYCMKAVLDILNGEHESVEGCLQYWFNKKFSSHMIKSLQEIWGKLK